MSKAVLIDITKCVGCGSCTVACKMWNDLKFDKNDPALAVEPRLSDNNWTTVSINPVKKDEKPVLRFVKQQCLHCVDPACASACFARAFQKTPEGPVVYYPSLCVGCRYCMLACPFDIPKYEWDKPFPVVQKCQMCSTKVAAGEAPSCVSVCPTNVMKFGEREELLAEARAIIESDDRYVKHIYGEKEAGGTSWFYISDVPFEQLGFNTKVPTVPMSGYSHGFLKYTPYVIVGWGALLTGLYIYTKRRNEIAKEENKDVPM